MTKLEHEHTAEAIRERLGQDFRTSYLRDWVYGGIDGAVTTFAVVAGVAGAELSTSVILILGFANLVGDGFSMAAGNYSGTKTEEDDRERLLAIERKHIALVPEGERDEIRAIFSAKGFGGRDLDRIVDVITSDETRWARTMLVEEYGLSGSARSPLKAAAATFAAFLLCGLVPLAPFLAVTQVPFSVPTIATGLVFFLIGSAKSRWSLTNWWRSGLETFAIGMGAALLAYFVGYAVKALTGYSGV